MTEPKEDEDDRYGEKAPYDDVFDGTGALVQGEQIPLKVRPKTK